MTNAFEQTERAPRSQHLEGDRLRRQRVRGARRGVGVAADAGNPGQDTQLAQSGPLGVALGLPLGRLPVDVLVLVYRTGKLHQPIVFKAPYAHGTSPWPVESWPAAP